MANKKISQLTDGTSFQAGDEAVVNRSGTNYKVDPTQFGSSINVTGTVTADGLTVDGDAKIRTGGPARGLLVGVDLGNSDSGLYYEQTGKLHLRGRGGYPLEFNTAATAGTNLKRMDIASNGDISFYEDTGTTPKFFWDASAESLGIGTSSPRSLLNVVGSTSAGGILTLENSSGSLITDRALGQIDFYSNDGSANGTGVKAKIQAIALNSIGNEVGITFGTSGTGSATAVEAMRIDSSGDVLFGKTDNNNTTAGIKLDSSGYASFVQENGYPIIANRLSSDGELVQFRKDGSTVGSIGSNAGQRLTLGNADVGLIFQTDSTDYIGPYSMTAVGGRDNAINLGFSTNRFKDLYLSGGVYLGGTGAANLLDDYEEGTFTPGFSFGGGSTGITYSAQSGAYTKIGRMVYCQVYVALTNNGTDTGDANLTGLPFTVGDVISNTGVEPGGLMPFFTSAGANVSGFTLNAIQGATTALIYALPASGTAASAATDTDITDTFNCRLFLIYSV